MKVLLLVRTEDGEAADPAGQRRLATVNPSTEALGESRAAQTTRNR